MGEPVTGTNYQYIGIGKGKYALTGLKVREELNKHTFQLESSDGFKTKMYRTNDEDITEENKRTIRNYSLDVVSFDQQGNSEEKMVDNFIRLNQNVHCIVRDSFELWNSFQIPKVINDIKQVAQYGLFKQSGKRMKEEELVTILAYAKREQITIDNMEEFFSAYKHLENKDKPTEHYEVQISIRNKENITSYLEKLEPNTQEENKFLDSIHSVQVFSEKLKILSDNNDNKLIKLFNPNIETPRKGNMKDFYITWIMLDKLDIHLISTYKGNIVQDLDEIFHFMKNMPENKTERDFIQYVKVKLQNYMNLSGTII